MFSQILKDQPLPYISVDSMREITSNIGNLLVGTMMCGEKLDKLIQLVWSLDRQHQFFASDYRE